MIMLTSSMQLDPAALRGAGISQWLTKPMRSMELYDRLMRLGWTVLLPLGLLNIFIIGVVLVLLNRF